MVKSESSPPVLDLRPASRGPMLDRIVSDEKAWDREALTAENWMVSLGDEVLEEIRGLAWALRVARLPAPQGIDARPDS